MVTHIKELIIVLNDLRKLYGHIYFILREEQVALQSVDSEQLSQIVARKNRVLSAIVVSDGRRQALLERIAEQVNGPINLSRVIEAAPADLAKFLRRLQKSLIRLVSEVRHINTVNDMVVEHSLENIKRMRMLSSAASGSLSYSPKGKIR